MHAELFYVETNTGHCTRIAAGTFPFAAEDAEMAKMREKKRLAEAASGGGQGR